MLSFVLQALACDCHGLGTQPASHPTMHPRRSHARPPIGDGYAGTVRGAPCAPAASAAWRLLRAAGWPLRVEGRSVASACARRKYRRHLVDRLPAPGQELHRLSLAYAF
jgi:hypothetical protein